MAITFRGYKGQSGHVTAVPDTELILLTRDGSPDVMEILDVGDGNPTVTGTYNFSGTGDVLNPVVYGDMAYVCDNNAASSKIWAFDISDVENGNVTLSGSHLVDDNPTAYGYITDGTYMYICTSNTYTNPQVIQVWDISDPTNMSRVGSSPNNTTISGPMRLMFHPVNNNYLLVIKNNLALLCNITNKNSPTNDYTAGASLFTQWGYVWCGVQYYASSGKGYLFMCYREDGGYPGGIEVYDITDPDTSTWSLVDDLPVDGEIGYDKFEIVGNYLYSRCWDHPSTYYIRVVDISDPENIALVDSLLASYTSTDQTFVQKSGGDPIFVTGYADNGTTAAYTVPVSAYKYSGTLSHDAHIYILNPDNMAVYRQNSFPAGNYDFPATTEQTPRHVLAERDSDGALLVYADVTPVLYSS